MSAEGRTGPQASSDYEWVERIIRYLDEHALDQPELDDLASAMGVSSSHLQRVFSRWVGISPKRFLQYLTRERARDLLRASDSLLDVTYGLGLSSPSRLHDLFVTCEAVTPAEARDLGAEVEIRWGFHPTPFGTCLLGVTDRGVCWLGFVTSSGRERALDALETAWPEAALSRDPEGTAPVARRIFEDTDPAGERPLHLMVRGTNFQIKVWEALLSIPPGEVRTYGQVAHAVQNPRAVRAVGSAVGKNPVAFLIPCHRVIRATGEFGAYGSGRERKRALLAWESALRGSAFPADP